MDTPLLDHLSALSEPLRLRLLLVLAQHELGVGELARVFQCPQSTVSRHLKTLQTLEWLERRAHGTAGFFRLAEPLPASLAPLWQVLAQDVAGRNLYEEDQRRALSVLSQREIDSRDFFGRNAEHWDQLRRDLFGSAYLVPTLAALLPPGLDVADLGCGTGELLVTLAPSARSVVGVDQEPAMLAAAARRVEGLPNVRLLDCGIERLSLEDSSIDLALSMLVLHHVEVLESAFLEVARVLRPAGRLVVLDMVEHDRRDYRRCMGHRHLGFCEQYLGSLARQAGLRVLSWRRLPPEPAALGPGLFLGVYGR